MKNQQNDESALTMNLAKQPIAKSFSIMWDLNKAARHTLREKLDPGAALPPNEMLTPDLRQISRLEWMDKVRRLFEVERLRIQFQTLEFPYTMKNKDKFLNLIDGSDWSQLQLICDKKLLT